MHGPIYRQCVTTPISTACPQNSTQTHACSSITQNHTGGGGGGFEWQAPTGHLLVPLATVNDMSSSSCALIAGAVAGEVRGMLEQFLSDSVEFYTTLVKGLQRRHHFQLTRLVSAEAGSEFQSRTHRRKVCLSVCLSVSVYLSVCLFVCLSVYSFCLFVFPSFRNCYAGTSF